MATDTPQLLQTMADPTQIRVLTDYLFYIGGYDYLTAIIIGIVVVISREIFWHYEGSERTTVTKTLLQIPEGITFGIFGNEVAGLFFTSEWNFLLVATFAWGGAEVLDKVVGMVIGMIEKTLPQRMEDKSRKDFEEREKDEARSREARRKVEDIEFEQYIDKLQASPDVDNL